MRHPFVIANIFRSISFALSYSQVQHYHCSNFTVSTKMHDARVFFCFLFQPVLVLHILCTIPQWQFPPLSWKV